MLKHPNIVRLYDVIETDKYIGIILDYASGGELFDHILAHRYLKEKDACRLFAQLISGVWYIHQRKIVHRDLKLENLLLDRNRNVIITDFGFANRFEHRSDDLMQTSCGSPCYAAPELVISEGSYVGSAVDIWSCGVILYAMLAGYLPFDDDPANPDGDNINLLYKYIVNTPLSFPDYISPEARDLLSIMLQPDPQRRADLSLVMQHAWLCPYAYFFEKTVDDLEASAIEMHKAKRQAYQRQMRNAAQASADHNKAPRPQNAKNDVFPHASVAVSSRSHAHAAEDQTLYETSADLAAASQAQAQAQRRGYNSTIVMPTQPSGYTDDDPFAMSPADVVPPSIPIPSVIVAEQQQQSPQQARSGSRKDALPPIPSPAPAPAPVVNGTGSVRSKAASGMRHTIQVEYGQPEPPAALPPQPSRRDATPKKEPKPTQDQQPSTPPYHMPSQLQTPQQRRPSVTGPRPPPSTSTSSSPVALPPFQTPTKIEPPLVTVNTASPPSTPHAQTEEKAFYGTAGSNSSRKGKHNRGLSIDKMGLGKFFGGPTTPSAEGAQGQSPATPAPAPMRAPSESSAANSIYTTISKISGSTTSRRPSTLQVAPSTSPSSVSPTVEAASSSTTTTQTSLLSPPTDSSSAKKNRRSTLSVMVEPIARTIKARPGRSSARAGPETPSREREKESSREPRMALPTSTSERDAMLAAGVDGSGSGRVPRAPGNIGHGMPASTSKARKVMQWFRSRSKGRGLDDEAETTNVPLGVGGSRSRKPSVRDAFASVANVSSSSVNAPGPQVFPTTGGVEEYVPSRMGPPHPKRTASTGAEGAPAAAPIMPSFAELVRRHVAPPKGVIRTHHGAVSQATVTTGVPIEVMRHVRDVLEGMGVDVQVESEYKYRCVRAKRRRAPAVPSATPPPAGLGLGLGMREPSGSTGLGLAAFTLIGSAASNGVRVTPYLFFWIILIAEHWNTGG
jgi:protein-serine/threonine kinase